MISQDEQDFALFERAGAALLPFLIEQHEQTGVSVQRVCAAPSTDRELWLLALLFAELPAIAEQAARALYGEQADSALRFLAAGVHERANAALTRTGGQIRARQTRPCRISVRVWWGAKVSGTVTGRRWARVQGGHGQARVCRPG